MECPSEEDWEQVSIHSKQSFGPVASPRCESPYVVQHPGHLGQHPGAGSGSAHTEQEDLLGSHARSDLGSSWAAAAFRTPSPSAQPGMGTAGPGSTPEEVLAAAVASAAAEDETPLLQASEAEDEATEAGPDMEGSEEVVEPEEGEAGTEVAEEEQMLEPGGRPPRNCFWRLFMSIPLLPVTVVLSLLVVTTATLIVHHHKSKSSGTNTRGAQPPSTTSAARAQAVY